ncbi:hypothetical protein [Hyalangium versicolor]|uniref:hypothetical protein n=1 Tax=Hyalangium versicolor TaxID=2861190 RepID=UPI001CCAC6CF|nr:hypothetical protein [Hyalangium versicolor]
MKRSRFLAAVLALGGLLGAAEVRSAANQNRLDEFEKKALKDRRAQGLDKNRSALFAKYPSPEIKLESGQVPTVSVGSETTLTVNGRFLPGSMANTECAGTEILSEKVTETRVEVRLRVTTLALPGSCNVEIISPVSLASATKQAFQVVGDYTWQLALANGMKARLRTTSQPGTVLVSGTSEWFGKDGKSLGTRPVSVTREPDGYRVTVQRSAEETAASDQAMEEARADYSSADNQKKMAEIQQKMQQDCMKLPPAQMGTCIQKYTEQMKTISDKAMAKGQAAQEKAAAGTVGCQSLHLQVNQGKVTGQGNSCGAPGDVAVTGSVSVAK